jgi:endogenous inhibitor of DNA gyrase (YacG/DUF329 family)
MFKTIEKPGWTLKCPTCTKDVLYTKLKNWDIPTPFFYCESYNDVLLRRRDNDFSRQKIEQGVHEPTDLEKVWNEILEDTPDCPHGKKFTLWANVRCPHCGKEFPYNQGVKNIAVRINEPEIILIDGAVVLGDTPEDSWKVKVVL